MKIDDAVCLAKGFVTPYFVNRNTGEEIRFEKRKNQLSYMSAEAMAAAFGGDPSFIPSRVGFIYGPAGAEFTGGIGRRQTWQSLLNELANASADVQVVSFSYSPSLGGGSGGASVDDSSSSSGESSPAEEGDYCNINPPKASNEVTFHAVSNSHDAGARGTIAFKTDDYIYQAVLLGVKNGKHYVISRVSLGNGGTYLQKPEGFEIALDWTVVFR